MSEELMSILQKLKLSLVQRLGDNLQLLTLYGSYARGEITEGSDVDLLVVLRHKTSKAVEIVEKVVYQAMWDTNFTYYLSLNLVDENHYHTWIQHEASLLKNIEQDGQVLWPAA